MSAKDIREGNQLLPSTTDIMAGTVEAVTETSDATPTETGMASENSPALKVINESVSASAAPTEGMTDNGKRKLDSKEDTEEMPSSPKRARTTQLPSTEPQTLLEKPNGGEMAFQIVKDMATVHQHERSSSTLSSPPSFLHVGESGEIRTGDIASTRVRDSVLDREDDSISSPLSSVPSSPSPDISSHSCLGDNDRNESGQSSTSELQPLKSNVSISVVYEESTTQPVQAIYTTSLLQVNEQADVCDQEMTGKEDSERNPDTWRNIKEPASGSSDDVITDPQSPAVQSAPSSTLLDSPSNGDKASQLLMPSSSTDLTADSGGMYSLIKTSGRIRKVPDRFPGLVPTATDVDELEASSSDAVMGRYETRSTNLPAGRKSASTSKRKASRPQRTKLSSTSPKQQMSSPKSKVTKPKKAPDPKPTATQRKQTANLQKLATSSSLAKWLFKRKVSYSKTKGAKSSKVDGGKTARKAPPSLVVILPLPQPDPDKLALSQKLTWREPLGLKLEPQGKPEVWADSRQALCETLPYFKSPQSGCYQNDGHVYGFLFDSIGHCREYMDENVIICRAGGGMESDGNGGMVQRKDHSIQESQVQAVLNDIAHHNPLIAICGNRNAKARCNMPHQYSVLGWYKPTLVWSEKTAGKGEKMWTTVKYRLERLNRHKPAWHAPKESQVSDEDRAIAGDLTIKECEECQKKYPQVYLRAWMCLNADCSRFWKFNGLLDAPCGSEGLEYDPAFLLHDSGHWNDGQNEEEPEPAPLRPPVPDFGNSIGDNLTYVNTRGICCPNCGRCNSRRLFKGWICENAECDFDLPATHRPVVPAMLHTPWDAAPTLVRNRHDPKVGLIVEHKDGYKVSTYTFDGIKGCFIHAAATKQIVQEENGPDDMFANMQVEDMGLERRTFAVKMSGGKVDKSLSEGTESAAVALTTTSEEHQAMVDQSQETIAADDGELQAKKQNFADGDLMTAFSMNYGMPYKFVASGASRPFEEGPWPVAETRRRLNWAARKLLNNPESDMDFNEELIFAYLEGQKIEYHDDGEEGLGPRIATLSLGGRAKMHMRMKMKYHVGCSKTGIFTEEEPVPGGIEYEKRLEIWKELQNLKGDTALYNQRRKEIPKELGIFDKRTKKAEDLVTITLSHGDIVVMDGYDIQKYLEHKVVPEGYLRFALTCRTVLGYHLKPEELPDYEVKKDDQTYDGPKI